MMPILQQAFKSLEWSASVSLVQVKKGNIWMIIVKTWKLKYLIYIFGQKGASLWFCHFLFFGWPQFLNFQTTIIWKLISGVIKTTQAKRLISNNKHANENGFRAYGTKNHRYMCFMDPLTYSPIFTSKLGIWKFAKWIHQIMNQKEKSIRKGIRKKLRK